MLNNVEVLVFRHVRRVLDELRGAWIEPVAELGV
jgi:hypothetical protein